MHTVHRKHTTAYNGIMVDRNTLLTNEFVGSTSGCVDLVVDVLLVEFHVGDVFTQLASSLFDELVEVVEIVADVHHRVSACAADGRVTRYAVDVGRATGVTKTTDRRP